MVTGHGQNLPLLWSGKHFIGFSMLKDAIPSSVLLHSASEVLPRDACWGGPQSLVAHLSGEWCEMTLCSAEETCAFFH